jgi:hypothetical protein
VLLYFFLLAIVLSVLFRYTDADCPCGIFKLLSWMIYRFVTQSVRISSIYPFPIRRISLIFYRFSLQIDEEVEACVRPVRSVGMIKLKTVWKWQIQPAKYTNLLV